jgi:conjugative relaxase-like TrwC/TraI family protein
MIRASGALTASQGKDYYDKEYSRGDYYTEDGHAVPGQWSGLAAERLGLQGEIEKEVFEAVLEGKAGPTGDQLIPGEVGTGKHRAGWDFTCSPEKSVSIMALVGGDAGILDDVRASNAKAMVELERFAMGKDGARQFETTGNLVIASFQHETSRRLDPQLHIHNVVMNMTRRADGKFVGLETREMFAAQTFVKSVFHADLARRLQARGYAVEIRPGGVAAIRDVPIPLMEAFSQRRRKDIEPYLAAHGQSGAKAAEKAAIRTRKVKDRDVSREALREFWAATVREQGVDLRAIRDRAERVRSVERTLPGKDVRRDQARAALAFAAEHVSERKAAFTGRELLGAALRQGMGVITLEDVREVMKGNKDLVQVEAPDSPSYRFTTDQAIRLERSNLKAVKQGKGASRSILDGDRFAPSRPLSDGQRKVAEHILSSQDQVLAVEGKAGAGKTYTLQTVVAEATGRGWTVRGFAPDTSAVKTLAAETGVQAKTLAALARERPDPGEVPRPQLWLVDEAGKMSSRHAANLFEQAQAAGAKVVLVGDRLQHAAVEAGMPFAYLQGAGLRAERLDEIRRQKDPELLAAVVEASEGRTREAVAKLVAQGKVTEHVDLAGRHQAVVRDYMENPQGQSCIVIAPSNDERRDLNHRIREALIEAGKVQKASYQASIRISRGLTQAQKQEVRAYQAGDLLTFQRGSKVYGIEQGATGRVAGVDLEHRTVQVELAGGRRVEFAPARFRGAEVHQVEPRRFAVGDRIQYREAQKPEGSRIQGQGFRIANGDTAIIRELDRETGRARVELEGTRRSVHLDLGRVQPVDHAYAITSHASQGRTVDRALVVVDTGQSRELVNRQQFYVSISRARLEARVYTSSREGLAAAVGRDAGKSSALDLVKGQGRHKEREVSIGQSHRTTADGVVRAGRPAERTGRRGNERAYEAIGLAREPWGTLGGGVAGREGGLAEPAAPAAERGGLADRAAERAFGVADPGEGPDRSDRSRLQWLDRTGLGRPGGHDPGIAGLGRSQMPAGGRAAGDPPGPDGREGRGHRPPGSRLEEPGLGSAGPAQHHRDGGRGWEAVPGPGAGGAAGIGAAAPGGRGPGREEPGAAHPAAPESRPAADLDRGDGRGVAGGRPASSGAEMNPGGEHELTRFPAEAAVLLERESAAGKLDVPRALKTLETDLQKASARIRACGLEDPFTEDRLRSLPPRVLQAAVDDARQAGLMTDGPEWTTRRDQVPVLVGEISRSMQRQLDLDRDQPGLARGI